MDTPKTISDLQVRKRAFTLFEEFKAFALKGNVIDLAVAVIIGAAFSKIIDSLVKSIIMPLISIIMPSEQGYTEWRWVINGKVIPYGQFLGAVVEFLLVALVLFLLIRKFLGLLLKEKKQEVVAPPPLTKDQELLVEIRDALRNRPAAGSTGEVRVTTGSD